MQTEQSKVAENGSTNTSKTTFSPTVANTSKSLTNSQMNTKKTESTTQATIPSATISINKIDSNGIEDLNGFNDELTIDTNRDIDSKDNSTPSPKLLTPEKSTSSVSPRQYSPGMYSLHYLLLNVANRLRRQFQSQNALIYNLIHYLKDTNLKKKCITYEKYY